MKTREATNAAETTTIAATYISSIGIPEVEFLTGEKVTVLDMLLPLTPKEPEVVDTEYPETTLIS